MTDDPLLIILLLMLTFTVALNLYLTLRLMNVVLGSPESSVGPLTMPIGESVPEFRGRTLADGRPVSSAMLAGQASVLVFLSSACGDCRQKIPELARLRPAMQEAGVRMWLIAMEPEPQVAEFLGESPLREHLVIVNPGARRKLNPRSSAPFYAFLDHDRTVLASNFIGDENWLSFVEQMEEISSENRKAAS